MDRQLSTFEALTLLGSLEVLTREHLPRVEKKQPPAEQNTQTPIKVEFNADSYSTTKVEYQPALQDKSLIEALVQFQKEITTPQTVREKQKPKNETVAPEKPKQPEGFQLHSSQNVTVTAKPPGNFHRSPGVYQTILRSGQ